MSGLHTDSLVVTLSLIAVVSVFLMAVGEYAFGVKVVPYVIGFPTLLLLLVILIGEFRPASMKRLENALESLWGGNSTAAESDESPLEHAAWGSVGRIMLWGASFFALIYYFGFYVVPFFFIVFFLVIEAQVKIVNAVVSAGIALLLLYGGLGLLNVDLWQGVMLELVPGLLGGSVPPPL